MSETFAQRLSYAMNRLNIKQTELSERTGISKASISEYLSGNYEPKQKNIYKLSVALSVEPSYLMGITGFKQIAPAAPTTNDLAQLARDDAARAFIQMLCKDNPEAQAIISRMQVTATGELSFPDLSDASQAVINSHLQAMIAALQKATDNGDGTKTVTWKPNK